MNQQTIVISVRNYYEKYLAMALGVKLFNKGYQQIFLEIALMKTREVNIVQHEHKKWKLINVKIVDG